MATVEQLADANMAQIRRLTDFTLAAIREAWWSLGDWHDPGPFTQAILPVLEGAQLQTAALTDAYLSALLSEALDAPVPVLGLSAPDVTELRAGTTMAEAYARPFHTVWYQQSKGMDLAQALRLGLDRAEHMATMDIQLARTHAASAILQESDVVTEYQRALSGTENCDLCSLAAKNEYKTSDLMPVHTKCDCTVAPVIEGRSLVRNINQQRSTLNPEAERAQDNGETTKRVAVGVEAHGELGPVLVRKQETYPTFTPDTDGWSFDGRGSGKEAGVKTITPEPS